jgi:hypothetical protein
MVLAGVDGVGRGGKCSEIGLSIKSKKEKKIK